MSSLLDGLVECPHCQKHFAAPANPASGLRTGEPPPLPHPGNVEYEAMRQIFNVLADGEMSGANEQLAHIDEIVMKYFRRSPTAALASAPASTSLPQEQLEACLHLVATDDVCITHTAEGFGLNIWINVNDQFYPAADGECIDISVAPELWELYKREGSDGLVRWVQRKRDNLPLRKSREESLQTREQLRARIKELEAALPSVVPLPQREILPVVCAKCHTHYDVARNLAGSIRNCPNCGDTGVLVPAEAALLPLSAEHEKSWDSLRDLAVQIVDNSCGYTMEFAGSPSRHRGNYDWVEDKLKEVEAYAAARANPSDLKDKK